MKNSENLQSSNESTRIIPKKPNKNNAYCSLGVYVYFSQTPMYHKIPHRGHKPAPSVINSGLAPHVGKAKPD